MCTYVLKGWTPQGRITHLTPLLQKIGNFCGKKVRGSHVFIHSRDVCLESICSDKFRV